MNRKKFFSILRLAAAGAVPMLLANGCTSGSAPAKQPRPAADSLTAATAELAEAITDTIRGRVTDAASRTIELSVVMDLELTDDVDRQTEVVVGKDIEVVLRHEPDGTQTVVAVRAADDE